MSDPEEAKPVLPPEFIRMRKPGDPDASFNGLTADLSGALMVPFDQHAIALDHGFVIAHTDDDPAAPATEAQAAPTQSPAAAPVGDPAASPTSGGDAPAGTDNGGGAAAGDASGEAGAAKASESADEKKADDKAPSGRRRPS